MKRQLLPTTKAGGPTTSDGGKQDGEGAGTAAEPNINQYGRSI
jgi:hypothetical protein